MTIDLPFTMVISWSDVDRVYIAHLPEFGSGAKTHGSTYEEAAKNGREVLEMLVESYIADGQPLPKPSLHNGPAKSATKSKQPAIAGRKLRTRTTEKHATA